MELAHQSSCLQSCPCAGYGLHHGIKTQRNRPLSAHLFAEMINEAGFPPGVFNLVNGSGTGVGKALAEHPDIDMISFTGSTRAGIAVAKAAADSVKRVTQELGGKSPNILLEDADFDRSIKKGIFMCMENTGQSCNAPTRMLIPHSRYQEAQVLAQEYVKIVTVDNPKKPGRTSAPWLATPNTKKCSS
jgi:aldehyde dehydrogenase (NAD+)